VLHFVAWLFVVFIYHANSITEVRRHYLPVYALLGASGVWLFLITIVVDIIAAIMLVVFGRRSGTWPLVAAVINLPIIPLGTILGFVTIVILALAPNKRA
jgi:hypothetical protein